MNTPAVTLMRRDGRAFATAAWKELGGGARALVFDWLGATSPPESPSDTLDPLSWLLTPARPGASAPCFSRVVRQDSRAEPSLLEARARWHRAVLEALGFAWQADRLEVRMPLSEAIAAAAKWPQSGRLAWESIASEPGPPMEHAAKLLKACAVGDPDTEPDEDALGFLLARRGEPALQLTPECLQMARWDGRDAAIMAISVKPDSGWCSFYYLGVLPECRRQGFAQEAMRRGFEVMQRAGGREYRDGTASGNTAALALLESLGAVPDRTLEQWRWDR